MKKFLGLALVPVVLASLPLISYSKDLVNQKHGQKATPAVQTMQNGPWAEAVQITTFSTPEIRKQFLNGQWQLVDKNYPEAIKQFEIVLKSEPNSVRALHGAAMGHFLQGDNTTALQRIDRAIALDPVNTKLLFTKARILDAMDKDVDALESYLTFAAMDPTDSSAIQAQRRSDELFHRWESRMTDEQKQYFNGLRFLSMEQPENAAPVLEKFLTLQPADLKGRYLLGVAYRNLNLPDQALAQFEKIANSQPDNAMTYFQMGVVYDQFGKKQNATEAWKNFVKFAPHAEQVGAVNQYIQPVRR